MFYLSKAAKSKSNEMIFTPLFGEAGESSFISALSPSNTFRGEFNFVCHVIDWGAFEMDFLFAFIFKFNINLIRFHIFTLSRIPWM